LNEEEKDPPAFDSGQVLWVGADDFELEDTGEAVTIVDVRRSYTDGNHWNYELLRSNGSIMVLSQIMLLEFYRIGRLQILA